ncbi:Lrp/AsnC family transcriptional regulator [Leucobacter coleopterorum]|uniref:Lrp/AsnC family transcriptional regulator n=1 Tax=Leucobacter coleopterorum TaxID=2714933 RepID=A0ABX6JTQ3_9MICO|nr:Lrp/AsnC family transcriptional regulator [Leucobacter coleopterorum]QIM17661.1 Lrp/AsnC family transcriptional regulator [Leucobacter coleopterorum]
MSVDEIDRAILEVLREDARVSMTSLAEAVHISRAGAHARVKRLVDSGVIRNFTVRTDPVQAGAHASAYVTLQIDQTGWKEIRSTLGSIEEVEHIALVGGEFDVLLLVRADDNSHLRRVVLEGIQTIPWVRSSRTILIFEDFPGGVPEE